MRVLVANIAEFLIIAEIIIAIRQVQPGLIDIADILGRILEILVDEKYEGRLHSSFAGIREIFRQVFFPVQAFDPGQILLQRRQAEFLDPRAVHVAEVEITDLLLVGAVRLVAGLSGILDDPALVGLAFIEEFGKGAVVGFVGGNLGLFQPGAVDVAVKIILGPHRLIKIGVIDPGIQFLLAAAHPNNQAQQQEGESFKHEIIPPLVGSAFSLSIYRSLILSTV